MRSQDWKMAVVLKKHWQGEETLGINLCPLLASLDDLLLYLDELGIKPGNNIPKCPACGEEHRWSFLRTLMQNALMLKPTRHTALLELVDRKLDPVRAQYGGEEPYREMLKAAEEFFEKLDVDHVYKPK